MYNKLHKQAANELDLVERLSHVKKSNKKAREVRDIRLRTLGV
jgi:hypothetical protein